MTDLSHSTEGRVGVHTTDDARNRLAKRYGAERRFRLIGLSAVLLAGLFLVLLLSTVVTQGLSAFTYHYVTLPFDLSKVKTEQLADLESSRAVNFDGIVKQTLKETFPQVSGRRDKRALKGLLSAGASIDLRKQALENPDLAGKSHQLALPLSDYADLYMKGLVTETQSVETRGTVSPVGKTGRVEILSTANDFNVILTEVKQLLGDNARKIRKEIEGKKASLAKARQQVATLEAEIKNAGGEKKANLEAKLKSANSDVASINGEIEKLNIRAEGFEKRAGAVDEREVLNTKLPSYLIAMHGGVAKILSINNASVEAQVLIPFTATSDAKPGEWTLERLTVPEDARKFKDKEIVWLRHLERQNLIEERINTQFFTAGPSREPEVAGIWGAVVGSLFTMFVTLLTSFPLGVAAAIYLEEFAKPNRWTHLIEVNINNLAAVPSIVFGLLGAAVFLGAFGMPRSVPVVGGLVLALMTLPTIIIASRAALKAVPPSIREAALGIGASRIQTVFHHVLPLAMPGILTGTIIGMAQALGETAPLLMIGMVAFIADVPVSPMDPATVLPVQIYMWSDFPEQAFQQKTAAAIMVLLGFLIAMNAIAVVLRKRFERRW